MRIMKTNWMKKNLQFALMAAMMLPSALVLNACSDDDKPDSGEVDARIEKVVPNEYRKQMEKYITIYDGVNPPNVEGVFIAESPILVYDSSGTYEPGKVFYDYYYKFSNQNSSKNTVDYKRTNEEGNDTESSTGAFISGDGKNFTIFFNTIIQVKRKSLMVIIIFYFVLHASTPIHDRGVCPQPLLRKNFFRKILNFLELFH